MAHPVTIEEIVTNLRFPGERVAVQVDPDGRVVLKYGSFTLPLHSPEISERLADAIRRATVVAPTIVTAHEDAARLRETLRQAEQDRLTAIIEGAR